MFKARNILGLFILNYLLLLIASSILELALISNKAEQVELLVRTAADMALDQVQATDDYFTSGGGYFVENGQIINRESYYMSKVIGSDGKYTDVALYELVTGETDVGQIYRAVYPEDDIFSFVNNLSDVKKMKFVGSAGKYYGTNYQMSWFGIPVIAQMGYESVWNSIRNSVNDTYGVEELNSVIGFAAAHKDSEILNRIETMFELTKVDKEHLLTSNSTETSRYYLTPLSLGVTYINPELLQAFFMNNMELLMRSKYTQNADYIFDNYYEDAVASNGQLLKDSYGNGILRGTFYANMVDEESLKDYNPINNGLFTLLRGEKHTSYTSNGMVTYYLGMTPKIEYRVIDMYDNSYNSMLKQVLGYFIHDDDGKFINVTGTDLKKKDIDVIDAYKRTVYGDLGSASDFFEHKYFVVAKVTFYADIIIPYDTPSLREMRGRIENDGKITGRTLFDAFSYVQTSTSGVPVFENNYVDVRTRTVNENKDKIYLTDRYGDLIENLDGSEYRSAFTYTTFFAVTP